MSKKTVRLFTVSVLLMAGGMHALAETPTESVTVTGSRRVLHDFTRTFAAPTPVTGKIARWEHPICPVVAGQNPHFTNFITQRVKYIALAAGAPVNTEASCTPNIDIVFTTTPQDLLDTLSRLPTVVPPTMDLPVSSRRLPLMSVDSVAYQAWMGLVTVASAFFWATDEK